jgi:putative hydrolase of the HAD superfamily
VIKAVIFDFFGVIGESTLHLMSQHFKLTAGQIAELHNTHKLLDYEFIGSKKYLETYAQIAGTTYDEVLKIYQDSKNRFKNTPEVMDLIISLKRQYKIALISNISHQGFDEFIRPIKDYFDVIVTSYEYKLAKPERAIFELCAQKLGVDVSECVMVDDNYINCQGARAAGMEAIEFTNLDELKNALKIYANKND